MSNKPQKAKQDVSKHTRDYGTPVGFGMRNHNATPDSRRVSGEGRILASSPGYGRSGGFVQ